MPRRKRKLKKDFRRLYLKPSYFLALLRNSRIKNLEQVKVAVRCRPMNRKEMKAGYSNVVKVSNKAIVICEPSEYIHEYKKFTFDAVYDYTTSQEQLYRESVEPIVESVLQGFNATIFAYGQTGTGKTYTMEGKQFDRIEKGVIPRSFDQIFDHIRFFPEIKHTVRCSYIEIYQEEIKDLLDGTGRKRYELRGDQSSIYIQNLKSYVCKSAAEMQRVMKIGNSNRKTGATNTNEHSSRSHAIFIITVEILRMVCDIKHVKIGKLNLVDLAGSERQAKSKSSGVRLKEATKINLSLSALGNVISALSKEPNSYIPYRNSKLTRFLQDSLGGNAKTLMIANIGPASYNYIESLNTLKYANRAKNIKNKPLINEDNTKDEMIRRSKIEIDRLKKLVKLRCPLKVTRSNCNLNEKRKRTRLCFVREDIFDMRTAVRNEERNLYATCEKIVRLQSRTRRVEKKVGTSVLIHTTRQQQKFENILQEINKINMKNEELKHKIEEEKRKEIQLRTKNVNKADNILKNLRKLHRTYNQLVDAKAKTRKMNIRFDTELYVLENKYAKLYKRRCFYQILVDYFMPQTVQELFTKMVNRINLSVQNTEKINRMLQKLKFEPLVYTPVDQPSCSHTYPELIPTRMSSTIDKRKYSERQRIKIETVSLLAKNTKLISKIHNKVKQIKNFFLMKYK